MAKARTEEDTETVETISGNSDKKIEKRIVRWTYDQHGGNVLFETEGYGEKEKITVEVEGVTAEIENYGNLAIYAKGSKFSGFPAVKY